MTMDRSRLNSSGSTLTSALALLLIICLAECATGSCLSYGHSCWGAHGKRSDKPAAAPDWLLDKLFRRNDYNNVDLNHGQRASNENAIYRVAAADDSTNDRVGSEAGVQLGGREMEAKPMLDGDVLDNLKFWQIMREAAVNK